MQNSIRDSRWGDNSDVTRTCYVPWDPDRDWPAVLETISRYIVTLRDTPYTPVFCKRTLAELVFDINRLEGTISPTMQEGATLRAIHNFVTEGTPAPEEVEWNAEGGRDMAERSNNRQLFQCADAAKYLLMEHRDDTLSCELIVETHRRLMQGAYDTNRSKRTPVLVGRMRRCDDEEAYAGTWKFMPASIVERCVEHLAVTYESLRSRKHPIDLASYLFYEMISIHPFTNGNGRLSRLFMAWSLMRDGLPFPICFSSGHRSRRNHYMHAITSARSVDGGNRAELNVILIASVERTLANYADHVKRLADIS